MQKLFPFLLCLTIGAHAQTLSITGVTNISATTVGLYQRFEAGAQLNQTFSNNYDSGQVNVWAVFTAPSGMRYLANAFWYQPFSRCYSCPDPTFNYMGDDSCTTYNFDTSEIMYPNPGAYLTPLSTSYPWRVRFAPTQTGSWSYKVYGQCSYGLDSSSSYSFTVTSSADNGFVGVKQSGRNFCYRSNGNVFIPIGINCVIFGTDISGKGYDTLYNRIAMTASADMLQHIVTRGGNFMRIMMNPDDFGIEWLETGLGDYHNRQNRAFDLDSVLTAAEQNGVYLQINTDVGAEFSTADSPGSYFTASPYNITNGGVISDPSTFFTDSACNAYYRQKLRYIMARWGYSPHVLGFELIQEIDLINYFWNSGVETNMARWYKRMVQYGKSLNSNAMFTVSVGFQDAGKWSPSIPDSSIFGVPGLDYINAHNYGNDYNLQYQRNYAEWQTQLLFPTKPMFYGEVGNWWGNDNIGTGNFDSTLYDGVEWHSVLWSSIFGGAAAPGVEWSNFVDVFHPYYPCWGGQYDFFQPLSIFLTGDTIFNFVDTPIANTCTGSGPKDYPHTGNPANNRCDCVPVWYTADTTANTPYVVHGIATNNDSLTEVFGLKTANRVIGWIHNKQDYWYALKHSASGPDYAFLVDNQIPTPVYPHGIPYLSTDSVTIYNMAVGTYKLQFYSTWPSYPIATGGMPDSGGIIPSFTVDSVYADCNGNISFKVPLMKPLAVHDTSAPYAPDYAFKLTWLEFQAPDTIKTATTWNTSGHLYHNVVIASGATLTITNDTINIAKDSMITVLPGGRLILNHATLSNDCGGCFWQGIQVRGNSSLPQYAADQGWVTVEGGSTIQHARVGITNWDQADSNYATTGGVIQAYDGYFIDDNIGVSFMPYNSYSGAKFYPNRSYFFDCTFSLDNNYKGDATNYPFAEHAYLNGVEGVQFDGCQFLNRDTATLDKGMGTGIYSYNAGFSVYPFCTPPFILPCTPVAYPYFSGFTNGIAVVSDAASISPTVSIDQAKFDSVTIGVNISLATSVSVTGSTFIIGHGNASRVWSGGVFTTCNQNIGLLIQNSPQFREEADSFIGKANPAPSFQTIGILVSNTGATNNTIYRNAIFDSLTEGIYAFGNNCGHVPTSMLLPPDWHNGLQISCNTFGYNTYDIAISHNDNDTMPQGIAPSQNAFYYTGASYLPAGNVFSNSPNNIIDSANPIGYNYDSSLSTTIPLHISSNVSAWYASSFTTSLATVDSCPSSYSPYGTISPPGTTALSSGELSNLKISFNVLKIAYTDSLAVYNQLIDNGNTDSLLTAIFKAPDSNTLYNIVGQVSPFLSELSINSALITGKLTHNKRMTLLQDNPDVLRDGLFVEGLETTYSFSRADTDSVVSWSHHYTRRGGLEGSLSGSQMVMDKNANQILMALKTPTDTNSQAAICTDSTNIYYLLDSNSYYYCLDKLIMKHNV